MGFTCKAAKSLFQFPGIELIHTGTQKGLNPLNWAGTSTRCIYFEECLWIMFQDNSFLEDNATFIVFQLLESIFKRTSTVPEPFVGIKNAQSGTFNVKLSNMREGIKVSILPSIRLSTPRPSLPHTHRLCCASDWQQITGYMWQWRLLVCWGGGVC